MGAETSHNAERLAPADQPVIQFTIEQNFLADIKKELAARDVPSKQIEKRAFTLAEFLKTRLNVADVQPGDQFVISATEAIRFDRRNREVSRAALGPRMRQFFGEVLELGVTTTRDLTDLKHEIASGDTEPLPPETSIFKLFDTAKKWSGLDGKWNSALYARAAFTFLLKNYSDICQSEEIDLQALDRIGTGATNRKLAITISALPADGQKLLFEMLGDPAHRQTEAADFDSFRDGEVQKLEVDYKKLLGNSTELVGFNPETKPKLSAARRASQIQRAKLDLLHLAEKEPRTIELLQGIATDLAELESDLPDSHLQFINAQGNKQALDLPAGRVILTSTLREKGDRSTHEHGLALDIKTSGYADAVLELRAIYFKTLARGSEAALVRLADEGRAGAAAVLQFEKKLTAQSSAKKRMTDTTGLIQYIDNREHGSGPHDHINLSRVLLQPEIAGEVDQQLFEQVLKESRKAARAAVIKYRNQDGQQMASLAS